QPLIFKYDWQAIKNLSLQSENLSVSPWASRGNAGAVGPIVTGNYGFAPDGSCTATKIQFLNTGLSAVVTHSVAPAPGNHNIGSSTWTFSIWLRVDAGVSSQGFRLILQEPASPFTTVAVNLPNITSTWQRYSVTLAMPASTATTVGAILAN